LKRFITLDDFYDLYHKFKQRGLRFILSRFNSRSILITKSAFNQTRHESADWWVIPTVRERWNKMISGNPKEDYISFFVNNYLSGKKNLKLISFGSGSCSAEIELAKHGVFEEIVCVDIAKNRLDEAREIAKRHNLDCMNFLCQDANSMDISSNYYDIVFFQASLHHFDNIKSFTENSIKRVLKDKGLLVINEYVGPRRLQFPKTQIIKINEGLNLIPKKYKTRYLSNLSRRKYYGSGILRMILADPSECIDSESILPSIYTHFEKIAEKPFGGSILMTVLKDISNHFLELNGEKSLILTKLFDFEDIYLKNHSSDFIFGVYQKKSITQNIYNVED